MTGYESKKKAAQDKLVMTKDEALKLALEALQFCSGTSYITDAHQIAEEAIADIEQVLTQPEQKPVAWSYWQSCLNDEGKQTAPWVHRFSKFKPSESIINKEIEPLYTAPPQRKWQGLTDEEIDTWNIVGHESLREFVRAIEAKLKEKNT